MEARLSALEQQVKDLPTRADLDKAVREAREEAVGRFHAIDLRLADMQAKSDVRIADVNGKIDVGFAAQKTATAELGTTVAAKIADQTKWVLGAITAVAVLFGAIVTYSKGTSPTPSPAPAPQIIYVPTIGAPGTVATQPVVPAAQGQAPQAPASVK